MRFAVLCGLGLAWTTAVVLAADSEVSQPTLVDKKIDPSASPSQAFVSQPGGLPPMENGPTSPASFSDPTKLWTLPELVDEGLKRNPSTTQAWEQANSQAAQVGVAKSAYYPTVTLGATGTASHDITPTYPGSQENNTFSGAPQLQLQYLLLDFGARKAALSEARFNLLSQNFNYNQSLQKVVLGVMTSYYSFDGAKAQLNNAETALSLAEATLRSVTIKQKVGLSNVTDVAQAEQTVEQDKYNLENARGTVSTAQIQLATNLGIPGNTEIQIAEPSSPPSLAVLEQEVDRLIDLAFHQRPDLAAKYNTWRAQLAAVDQAEANRWPQLTTAVNLQRTYYHTDTSGGSSFGGQSSNFSGSGHYDDASASLTFSFDLFDGGNKAYQENSARHLAEAAKADLLNTELGVISDVVTNFVAFKTAAKRVDAAQALVAASQKSFDSTQISYRNGLKTIIDLLTSQSALASAQSTLSQSRTDLFTASSNLSNATGSLLPPISETSAFVGPKAPALP